MTKNIYQIKFLVLFILILIAFVRSPYIFLKGRFMYGDAFFYVNSLNNNWYESLFLIHIEAGYINLFSNISSFPADFGSILTDNFKSTLIGTE